MLSMIYSLYTKGGAKHSCISQDKYKIWKLNCSKNFKYDLLLISTSPNMVQTWSKHGPDMVPKSKNSMTWASNHIN